MAYPRGSPGESLTWIAETIGIEAFADSILCLRLACRRLENSNGLNMYYRFEWITVLALVLPQARAQQIAWTYVPPAGHVDVSPAFGDVNGDGRTDIVVGTTAGFVVAVDAQGKEIWRYQMRDSVFIPPTIADV